jgi:hypothetical protein
VRAPGSIEAEAAPRTVARCKNVRTFSPNHPGATDVHRYQGSSSLLRAAGIHLVRRFGADPEAARDCSELPYEIRVRPLSRLTFGCGEP